jgi:hypothetical protein
VRYLTRLTVLLGAALLCACGGGGGGDSSSTTPPSPSLYTIGGTIGGLTTTGLVLVNNGGNALSVPANATSFTFTTALVAGSSYDVTVSSQPSGQTCTVAGGSGTANADITSVAVSCQANRYTIGGTISGLTSAGLVLENNGGDKLPVPPNSTAFTFQTALSAGSAYDVTVFKQPSGELCTVSGGSGTTNGNVTDVAVSCQPTYTIGGTVSGLSSGVLVLEDNGGDEVAVPASATSFTFDTGLIAGSSYNVAIAAEPTALTCTVTGGSGTTGSANVSNVAISCAASSSGSTANVVPVTVGPGPASSDSQTFNIPYVDVQVCDQNGACTTIPNVLVDTGSSGLRLMASALTKAGLSVPAEPDPDNPSTNTIHECLQFVDSYAWGTVSTAIVTIGGETTGSPILIHVIDDSSTPSPAAPSACTQGTNINNVNAFDANGILGVSTANQDCGDGCVGATHAGNDLYWTCVTATGSCSSTAIALSSQVANPVASFRSDSNGVIVQLPSLPSSGATTTVSGSLVFGIGTETNNALNAAATVLTATAQGFITTIYGSGQPLNNSFIDSGSNALFFNDTTLQSSACDQGQFYCPSSPLTLSAKNQGANGTTSTISFEVADLNSIPTTDFAISNVAGPAPTSGGLNSYFDWGLPFFYGRSVYFAIEGMSAGGTQGPYYAY